MQYRILGKSGISVSELCLGTMNFGVPTEAAHAVRITHQAIDAGVNFIDCANTYGAKGGAETILGKALEGKRNGVVLTTKFREVMGSGPNDSGAHRYHLRQALEASLRRLHTDRIDVYFYHKPDYATPIEETLRALEDFVRAGKVLYIGCSNFYAWQVMEGIATSRARGLSEFVCTQPMYNIVNRDAELELLPLCQKYGLGVLCYSPLARGVLTGKYRSGAPLPENSRAARGDRRIHQTELRDESFKVTDALRPLAAAHGKSLSQFALAWALANRAVSSVIIGPRSTEQLEDNLGATGWSLTGEDERQIDALVPRGEHTGKGYNDPQYPVRGRVLA